MIEAVRDDYIAARRLRDLLRLVEPSFGKIPITKPSLACPDLEHRLTAVAIDEADKIVACVAYGQKAAVERGDATRLIETGRDQPNRTIVNTDVHDCSTLLRHEKVGVRIDRQSSGRMQTRGNKGGSS